MQTAVVPHRVRAQELWFTKRGLVADDVGQRLRRVKIEMRRDAPELQVEIDEDDPVRSALRLRSRCWSCDRGRPDAAFGL